MGFAGKLHWIFGDEQGFNQQFFADTNGSC
jgi:hypothetical protein